MKNFSLITLAVIACFFVFNVNIIIASNHYSFGSKFTLVYYNDFENIQEKIYWSKKASIKNWLENSGLPVEIQEKIFAMHIAMDEKGKKDYNMVLENGDCFIDMKFVILVGEKNGYKT